MHDVTAVIGLTTGGAAEKAGLRVGDVVWKVDGQPLAGARLAASLAAGASHTLSVAFMKGESGQAFEVIMPRPEGGLGMKVDTSNVIGKIQPGRARSTARSRNLGLCVCFEPRRQRTLPLVESWMSGARSPSMDACA